MLPPIGGTLVAIECSTVIVRTLLATLCLVLLLSLVVSSCDIKPENVLLQSKQPPYSVKLADFGLGEGLLDVQGAVSIAYASI